MTKANVLRLFEHYCNLVETGTHLGQPLTADAKFNALRAKKDVLHKYSSARHKEFFEQLKALDPDNKPAPKPVVKPKEVKTDGKK